jgi:L-seryl-tRNA(Ser) seleniumtransferase
LDRLATALRGLRRPVIGRIADGGLTLDLRCLADEQEFVAVVSELNADALAG